MPKIFEEFLNQLNLENKRKSTIDQYSRRLKIFDDYLQFQGILDVYSVTRADIMGFQRELLRQELSHRTINGVISTVCVYYKWAELEGLIDRNPVPEGVHLQTEIPKVTRLSDDDLTNFLSWVNTLQDNVRAAFMLMYGSGARVGEVSKLTYGDIQLRHAKVYINITEAKWGSDRCIPVIDQESARIVWQYRESCEVSNRPLFRVSRRTLQTYATQYHNLTGIEFHCHLLRHTFAARLLEQGVPITTIQFLLGHKNLNMTAHYTQSAVIDVSQITPSIFQERGTQHE